MNFWHNSQRTLFPLHSRSLRAFFASHIGGTKADCFNRRRYPIRYRFGEREKNVEEIHHKQIVWKFNRFGWVFGASISTIRHYPEEKTHLFSVSMVKANARLTDRCTICAQQRNRQMCALARLPKLRLMRFSQIRIFHRRLCLLLLLLLHRRYGMFIVPHWISSIRCYHIRNVCWPTGDADDGDDDDRKRKRKKKKNWCKNVASQFDARGN